MSNKFTPVISVNDINKSFIRSNGEKLNVLENICIDAYQGEFIGIVGHSGCGKTTLLRIICAFDNPDSGTILIDGIKRESPNKDVLMIFQSFDQLFPWKTVLQNVMFPLVATRISKDRHEVKSYAQKRIADVELSEFENSYPYELSGGMKQRAVLARALVLRPKVLLMDEPFASLDVTTRSALYELVRRVCTKYGITVLFVTHSVEEAVLLSDRIIIIKDTPGKINCILDNSPNDSINGKEQSELVQKILALL